MTTKAPPKLGAPTRMLKGLGKGPGGGGVGGGPGRIPVPPRMRPPWYKRKYLVYPKFQLVVILVNAFVTIVMFGFVGYQVVRSHIQLEGLVRSTRLPAQNLFNQMLTLQLKNLLLNLGVALFFSLMITSLITLFLSHRLAGPMIRLKNFFSGIQRTGDFPDLITFRNGDFFEDLPPVINGAFDAIKRKWQR